MKVTEMKDDYDLSSMFYDPLLHIPLRSVRRTVLEMLLDNKDKAILDLCCGTGEQLKLLSRHGFNDLHCLDISGPMLDIAKKNKNGRIHIYKEDATRTGFESGSFDVVIISLALHEKDRTAQKDILNEAHRLLRDDGLVIIVDFHFDAKTGRSIRIGISIVERIAGREHFNNFRKFIRKSGLSSLIEKGKFDLVEQRKELYNSMAISKYKKASS
jgi:ubiquinone/menaquinone biosynthesis C-methylase UbiE